MAVLLLVMATALGLAACGGGGASDEEITQIEKEAITKVRQKHRIDRLEAQVQRKLKQLNGGSGSSGTPNPPPSTPPAPSTPEGNCGGSLSVNSVTSCPFAENVRFAYEADIGSGSGTVEAFSPARGIYYDMYCSGGSPVECTGGDDAWLSFP